jgi:hypothetical protein
MCGRREEWWFRRRTLVELQRGEWKMIATIQQRMEDGSKHSTKNGGW